jgi:hypothetical protein
MRAFSVAVWAALMLSIASETNQPGAVEILYPPDGELLRPNGASLTTVPIRIKSAAEIPRDAWLHVAVGQFSTFLCPNQASSPSECPNHSASRTEYSFELSLFPSLHRATATLIAPEDPTGAPLATHSTQFFIGDDISDAVFSVPAVRAKTAYSAPQARPSAALSAASPPCLARTDAVLRDRFAWSAITDSIGALGKLWGHCTDRCTARLAYPPRMRCRRGAASLRRAMTARRDVICHVEIMSYAASHDAMCVCADDALSALECARTAPLLAVVVPALDEHRLRISVRRSVPTALTESLC